MKVPPQAALETSAANPATLPPAQTAPRALRVYLMDLWSFIPYYMARFCSSLEAESIRATLGSVRYHLDREYFRKVSLSPDPFLLDSGGSCRHNSIRRLVKAWEYLFNLSFLALRFTFSRPDILHVQYLPFLERRYRLELWFLEWVHRLGIPIVCTVHNVTKQNDPTQGRPLYRRLYTIADALICHGEEARCELIRDFGVNPDRTWVIPHGPLFEDRPAISTQEARLALGLPSDAPLILLLGVISEYKGVPFLLDAWKEFKQSGGKGNLVIAGTGDEGILANIRKKVSDEQIESVELRLRFIAVEELPLLHESADILVYPYKAGTTSGALLTGLRYGKAVIATRLPFFREYLRDRETALLVDYGDRSALASALSELVSRPEERLRMGAALLDQMSDSVTWADIGRKTRECYDAVLKVFSTGRGRVRNPKAPEKSSPGLL